MATATTITPEVVGVELTLTAEEAKALLAYLGTDDSPSSFRLNNPELYDIEDALEGARA